MRHTRFPRLVLVVAIELLCAPLAAAQPYIRTVAGGGPNLVPAIESNLYAPTGLALGPHGELYLAATDQHRVYRVDADGTLRVVAGNGCRGDSGDGGPATAARLWGPRGVAFDRNGNLLIADSVNGRIRRVDTLSGAITTVVGGGTGGDGSVATQVSLSLPEQMVLDGAGNMFIVETGGHRVRRVDGATGIVTTAAGTGVAGYSGDGGSAAAAALHNPRGLGLDASGDLYVSDTLNRRIRRVEAATGSISTVAGTGTRGFAGDGGPASQATLDVPLQIAVVGSGDLVYAEADHGRVRSISDAPPGSGVVPDGSRPGETGLVLAPSDGGIRLSWDRSINPNDFDYEVYEGPVGAFDDHIPLVCTTGAARSITIPPPAGDVYFLVVPRNAVSEGSYGTRSDGGQRAASVAACLPQRLGS